MNVTLRAIALLFLYWILTPFHRHNFPFRHGWEIRIDLIKVRAMEILLQEMMSSSLATWNAGLRTDPEGSPAKAVYAAMSFMNKVRRERASCTHPSQLPEPELIDLYLEAYVNYGQGDAADSLRSRVEQIRRGG